MINHRFRAATVWLVALFALLLAGPVLAQTFPKLTGRVVDEAHLLSPEQAAALDAKLAALEVQSQRQLVVVTLPDLQGYPIEDYSYRLGRAWGIGNKDREDGILLIVAPKERKVRIEVGPGVQGVLTDAVSSLIINREIRPRFKAGDMAGGIAAGTDKLIAQLQLPAEEATAAAMAAAKADTRPAPTGSAMAGGFTVLIQIGLMLGLLIWLGRRRQRMGLGRDGRAYGSDGVRIHSGSGFGSGFAGAVVGNIVSEVIENAIENRGRSRSWGNSWGDSDSGSSWGSDDSFSGGGGSFDGGGASGDW